MQDKPVFETSDQAEQKFYLAFENGDIEMMMSIWCKDNETVCIHPGGPRLEGLDNIRSSWDDIFNHEKNLKFEVSKKKIIINSNIALHHVIESIFVNNELQSEIIATNIYVKSNDGWKMVLHHASPELLTTSEQTHYDDLDEIQTIH